MGAREALACSAVVATLQLRSEHQRVTAVSSSAGGCQGILQVKAAFWPANLELHISNVLAAAHTACPLAVIWMAAKRDFGGVATRAQDAAEYNCGEPTPPALLLRRPPGGLKRAQARHAVSGPIHTMHSSSCVIDH